MNNGDLFLLQSTALFTVTGKNIPDKEQGRRHHRILYTE